MPEEPLVADSGIVRDAKLTTASGTPEAQRLEDSSPAVFIAPRSQLLKQKDLSRHLMQSNVLAINMKVFGLNANTNLTTSAAHNVFV